MTRLFCLAIALASCDTVLDPTGRYVGGATVATSDLAIRGPRTATSPDLSSSDERVTVRVIAVDETHVLVDLGDGCRLRMAHGVAENVVAFTGTVEPDQRCDLHVDGLAGTPVVDGTGTFRTEPPSLDLRLSATGGTSITWSYRFEGRRVP